MKKLWIVLAGILLCGALGTAAFFAVAEPIVDTAAVRAEAERQRLDRLEWKSSDELDQLPPEAASTREELAARLEEAGFSPEESLALMGEEPELPEAEVRYALIAMEKEFSFSGGRTLQPRFCVGLEYAPDAAVPTSIVSVGKPVLYGTGCWLEGDTFSHLGAGNYIYYDFNGNICRERYGWSLDAALAGTGLIHGSVQASFQTDGYITDVYESGSYISTRLDSEPLPFPEEEE